MNQPLRPVFPVVLVFFFFMAGCDYHINAFDPQLQPPKTTDEGAAAEVVPDDLSESVDVVEDTAEIAVPEVVSDLAVKPETSPDEVEEIPGCTDPEALNYDPTATVDDGSCMNNVTITFNVDMSCTGDVVAPQIAGGETFGMPGDYPMEDPDGDDVWTVSVTLPPGLTTAYTYTSDVCENWSCKENNAGQPSATDPYLDRSYKTAMEDQTINACFGNCGDGLCGQCPVGSPPSDTVESCESPKVKVVFYTDLAEVWELAMANVIALQGSFDGEGFWPGIVMERIPATRLFRVAVCLAPDADHTYKFASYEFANDVSEFPNGAYAVEDNPCPDGTVTTDCEFGTCTDRILTTADEDMVLGVYPWGECDGYPFEG